MVEYPLHPWWLAVAPAWVNPHVFIEVLAYVIGFRVLLVVARRSDDPVGDVGHRIQTAAGAVVGGALGSRLLFAFEDPSLWTGQLWGAVLGGKSVVGALLGGTLAVELVKRWLGVRTSTGDMYVWPLLVGLSIGRVGCLLAGVADGTHGIATSGWWGMDLGDGVARHPTALYEIGFLMSLGVVLWRLPPLVNGERYRVFLSTYLLWRVLIELVKPQPFPYGGLSAIQVASLVGLACYLPSMLRIALRSHSNG